MDAKPLTPRELFDGAVTYEIPRFQRPYVWSEEDQWSPLWEDVVRVTEPRIQALITNGQPASASHFMGAVVLSGFVPAAGDPARWSVIDGQQRLTTLQLLLDAARVVATESHQLEDAESLQELVLNSAQRFKGTPRRFKLRPCRVDQPAFEASMDSTVEAPKALSESRIYKAHNFFRQSIADWCESPATPGDRGHRLAALAEVLQHRLHFVAIDLTSDDDDQMIFETLNDRGTPLLAADKIKNYVFQACESLGADIDRWAEKYWNEFDDDWWREQVSQGRLFRSRIDLFLQYWLTMIGKEEVPADGVFRNFRRRTVDTFKDLVAAEHFMNALVRDADTFREFAQLDPRTARGRFHSRVIEALELGAFIPIFLWLISENHPILETQIEAGLLAIESWTVRRTLLRQTMKDVNRLVVEMLKFVDARPMEQAGNSIIAFLHGQTADARRWPRDEDLVADLPSRPLYNSVKQQRLRAILGGVELRLRSSLNEDMPLPHKLEIEHVMPQGWRHYWSDGIQDGSEEAARRDIAINSIGNLTLTAKKLNLTLSNRPWTDAETAALALGGTEPGLGKRSLLDKYSLLQLKRSAVDGHPDAWREADIDARGRYVVSAICRAWPLMGQEESSMNGGAPPTPKQTEVAAQATLPKTPVDAAPTSPAVMPVPSLRRQHTVKPEAPRNVERREFWAELLERAKLRTDLHSAVHPTGDSWISAGAGRSGTSWTYVVRGDESKVEFYIDIGDEDRNRAALAVLAAHKADIERRFGGPLDWIKKENTRSCKVSRKLGIGGRHNRAAWPTIQEAMIDAMIRLHQAISPYVTTM